MHVRYFTIFFCLATVSVFGQAKRNLLTSSYNESFLQKNLASGTSWVSLPAYADRKAWTALPSNYKSQLIEDGESVLKYVWQPILASEYLEYVKSGDRNIMQNPYNSNTVALKKLVLAELVEGKGRFLSQIIDGAWVICEMTSWSLSAHLTLQKAGSGVPDVTEPIIDLGVGNTSVLLAWTNYFLEDAFNKVNPLISKRIRYEINRQVLEPYYIRDDFWWMALTKEDAMVNNWNIWVNYNVLNCILLTETDPAKRLKGVLKTMRSSDKFINYYKEDGACEEGPAYWSAAGGMLYLYLDLLGKATKGAINKYDDPLVKNIGTYIAKAYINDHYYINYADASAKLNPDAGLIYNYGKAVKDSLLQGFGAYLANQQNWKEKLPGETLQSSVRNLYQAGEIVAAKSIKPLLASAWMGETGIATARDKAGSVDGFYFSALGGHNGESHNHNDVGTCIVFYNGQPLFIDIGSENYRRQTFGPERYTIWTMQSAWHNVPLINGVQQKEGNKFTAKNAAFTTNNSAAKFSVDISAAYPEEAGVTKWERSYELKKGKSFSISDRFQLSKQKGKTELHFITSNAVEQLKDGTLKLSGENFSVNLSYDPKKLSAAIEPVEITDSRLLGNWPKNISRLVFTYIGNKTSSESIITLTPNK